MTAYDALKTTAPTAPFQEDASTLSDLIEKNLTTLTDSELRAHWAAYDLAFQEQEEQAYEEEQEALFALPWSLSIAEAEQYVYSRFTHRLDRMKTLLYVRTRMAKEDWLVLLGDAWAASDNIYDHLKPLREILGIYGPVLPMMTPEEQAAYVTLPDEVTIYRGCSARFTHGASWSLDPDVARHFPKVCKHPVQDRVLITAAVMKKHVLAIKLDANEQEIITFMACQARVKPVTRRD
jgi:hypothetical protein